MIKEELVKALAERMKSAKVIILTIYKIKEKSLLIFNFYYE